MRSFYLFRNRIFFCVLTVLGFFSNISANQLPLSSAGFIENKGQILNQEYKPNADVLYLYSGKGIKIQLRKTGYSYELFNIENAPVFVPGKSAQLMFEEMKKTTIHSYRVDVDFEQMLDNPTVIAEQKSTDYLNYHVCGQDVKSVYSYQKIIYKNVYKNTDIEFILTDSEANPLKYNIILHPGADISKVKFLIAGATELKTGASSLLITTPLGAISENIPFSYYTDAPSKNEPVKFKLTGNSLTFSANYDNAKTLVIDPSSNLIWSTYYGGTALDNCISTRTDSQNNVYISGHTMSGNNIATNSSYQATLSGSFDAFIAKFNPNGVRQWATYYGGSSVEQVYAMHITPDDFIYITGDTFSTNFISTPGAHQIVYGGGIDDMVLAKFDTAGLRVWSTYFGSTEHEFAQAITSDVDGNIIIGGHTTSTVGLATPNAYSTTYSFFEEGLIAKFNSNGVLLWCTYYGDSGNDIVHSLTCDAAKNVYATGITSSIAGISTGGSHQPNLGGQSDAFIAKFDPQGSSLVWATYYGGTGYDQGNAIRTGPTGLLYLVGNTSSPTGMSTPAAWQPAPGSLDDGFISSFNANGVLQWSTYFGGEGTDYINDMVLDQNTNLVFCGQTTSTANISTTGAYQTTLSTAGYYDAYFAKFSKTGTRKLATYFGLPLNESARGIAVDQTDKVYITGETTSTVGLATAAAHQTVGMSGTDGFLAKFCMDIEPVITPVNGSTICVGLTSVSAASGFSTYLWSNGAITNPMVVNASSVNGVYQYTVYVTDGFGCTGSSATSSFTSKQCGVSIQEYDGEPEMSLYPVPSSDYLKLQLKNEVTGTLLLEVFNMAGQRVITEKRTGTDDVLSIKQLPPGVYVLRAVTGGRNYYSKFVRD